MSVQRMVVLLRGINVGGRHIVPMADLRECFAALGCTQIATYIQSGNVVCAAPQALSSDVIGSALTERFGFPVPVVLRTASEMEAVITANPFADDSRDMRHVLFLNTPAPPATWQGLEAKRAGEEQLAIRGNNAYLLLPHGAGRSKLAIAAPSLPGSPTMRNWNTVLQLRAMLQG